MVCDDSEYLRIVGETAGEQEATETEQESSEDSFVLHGITAGVPCVDSTNMNSTQKKGEAGRTFVDTSIFCEERRLMKEHYIYIECDRNWNAHLLAMRLTESHRTYCMTLSGKELGDTYDRPRLAVLALAHQFYIATDLSSFLERFGSVPVMRAFKFWASSEQEHAAELQEMMTKRVTPVDTAVEWSDVFLPSHRDNLKNYEAAFAQRVRRAKHSVMMGGFATWSRIALSVASSCWTVVSCNEGCQH